MQCAMKFYDDTEVQPEFFFFFRTERLDLFPKRADIVRVFGIYYIYMFVTTSFFCALNRVRRLSTMAFILMSQKQRAWAVQN